MTFRDYDVASDVGIVPGGQILLDDVTWYSMHAGKMASFDLETRQVLAGELDADDVDKVRVWMGLHREELFANWELLCDGDAFFRIEPLR